MSAVRTIGSNSLAFDEVLPVGLKEALAFTNNVVQANETNNVVIAFDLDETLLLNSWTGDVSWAELSQFPLFRAWRLFSLERAIQRVRRTRVEKKLLPLLHMIPALRNADRPIIEVAFRSGAIELLLALRKSGFRLMLITASAEIRVNYLFQRLPWFKELFIEDDGKPFVICGERIAEAASTLNRIASFGFTESQSIVTKACVKLHASEPPSLALKTPLLAAHLLGVAEGYDLLIDDNCDTEKAFTSYGLMGKLLKINGDLPHSSDIMFSIANSIRTYVECLGLGCSDFSLLHKEMPQITPFRLEDPLYLDCLKRTLAVPKTTNA